MTWVPPQLHTSSMSPKPRTNRRRSLRLQIQGNIQIRFATGEEPLELQDISLDGFAVWSATGRTVGQRRIFLVRMAGVPERALTATVVHIGERADANGRYLSGWYVTSEGGRAALNALVNRITGRLTNPIAS